MSRREFRLRSVLSVRRRELDAAQARLADEMRKKARAVQMREHHLARLHAASQRLHERLRHGAPAAMLRAVDGAMETAYASALRASDLADTLDHAIAAARAAVTDAKKKASSIEILEERFRERARTDRMKNEQKRLDDVANRESGGVFG